MRLELQMDFELFFQTVSAPNILLAEAEVIG